MQCAICLDDMELTQTFSYNCCHEFHSHCIDKWTKGCPCCRAPSSRVRDPDEEILAQFGIAFGDRIEVICHWGTREVGTFTGISRVNKKAWLYLKELEYYFKGVRQATFYDTSRILVNDIGSSVVSIRRVQ